MRQQKVIAAITIFLAFQSMHVSGQQYDAAQFKGALEQCRRELSRCHVVAANRGDQVNVADRKGDMPVKHVELWLDRDNAQFRIAEGDVSESDWWISPSFGETDSPLSAESLDEHEGVKVFVRKSGRYKWADSRPMRAGRDVPYNSLYSCSKTPQRTPVFYLPLIGVNRLWSQPGSRLAVDALVDVPLDNWTLVGRERIAKTDTVVIEIASGPPRVISLSRYDEQLSIKPFWKVWFSIDPDDGFLPVRIEKPFRYGFRGTDYPLELTVRGAIRESTIVFEAKEITRFGERLWYPRLGSEITFVSKVRTPFNPDDIVDSLIEHGCYKARGDFVVATHREWHLSRMEQVDENLDAGFEPPHLACVYDIDTEERYIVGVSKAESKRLLGLGFVQAPEPRTKIPWRYIFLAANVVGLAVLLVYLAKRT